GKQVILLAQTRPLHCSPAGIGTGQHLAGGPLASKLGVAMGHVPSKRGGPTVTGVLGDETELHYPAPAVGVPHVKSGKVRALGFTGAKRLASLPDVPTLGEAVPGYQADAGWHAVFAPAQTPLPRATRFQQAVQKALQLPQVRDHFVANGYDPQGRSPAEWAKLFRADLERYAEICRIAGIEPQ